MLFEQVILKIIQEYDLDMVLKGKSSQEIFETLVEAGISQEKIIKAFEREISIPFANVMNKEPDYGFIKKYGMSRIKVLKIFPFIEKDLLHIAIYDRSQIDVIDSMLEEDDEYMPAFCFDFVIEGRLADLEEELNNQETLNTGKEIIEVSNERKSILLATGQDNIDTVIDSSPIFKTDYVCLDKIQRRELLLEKCEELSPDIVLVGENIGGKAPLIPILINIKARCPETRIIFLLGKINPGDDALLNNLGILATMGVYDIIADSELSITRLQHVLKHPQGPDDVKDFIEKTKDSSGKRASQEIVLTVPDEVENEDTVRVYDNLFTFVSPMGAVGKSTIARNVAIALANHAAPNLHGKKPKIALIDLDLQCFATSRYLDTLDAEHNIFTALDSAGKAIDELGEMKELNKIEEGEVHEKIRHSFVQTSKYKNLYVLGGDDKVYSHGNLGKINSYYLIFIIESILAEFDAIIVDANTDIEADVVYPLYSMSRTVFNILDIRTDTFNMNKRFLTYLEDTGIYQPINNQFVLNKAFDMSETYLSMKDIQTVLDLSFNYIFPMLSPQMIFNMTSKNESIMDSSGPETAEFRAETISLANTLLPIKDIEELYEKIGVYPGKNKGKRRTEQKAKQKEEQKSETKGGLFGGLFGKR